jgi:peptidoglycan/LPS O-acetylase OafA/YrhL
MVLYQHCYAAAAIQALAGTGWMAHPYIIGNGWLGVGLFFTLSGFVLALPFCEGRRDFRSLDGYREFAVRRLRRLLPLMILGAAGGFLYALQKNGPEIRSFLLTISTLSMFTADEFFPTVFPVAWSLMVEVWASLALPLLILAATRWGWARTVIAVLIISMGVRLVGAQIEFINFHVRPLKDSVLGRIDDFMIGAWLAHLYVTGRLANAPKYAGAMGLSLFIVTAFFADLATYKVLPSWSIALVNNAAQISFGLMLVGALRFGSLTSRVLGTWPLTLIGAMCFSLYVWHAFFRGPEMMANPLDVRNNLNFWIPFLIVSAVTYRYVEFPQEPWRRLFRLTPRPAHSQAG